LIKQEVNYLQRRKKFFLIRTLTWATVILAIFIIGIIITKNRANYFTILAAVLTLGLAQNLTRYLTFRKYKLPDAEFAKDIDIVNDAIIYHSVIIPTAKGDKYFPHIILKANLIFFVVYDPQPTRNLDDVFYNKFIAKGIDRAHLHFCSIQSSESLSKLLDQINKIKPIKDKQEANSHILEGMIL